MLETITLNLNVLNVYDISQEADLHKKKRFIFLNVLLKL